MPDKFPYEYAVLRVVPLIERGEFMNVGVLMMCKPKRFIRISYQIDEERLFSLSPLLDLSLLKALLAAFDEVVKNEGAGGVIGALPLPERFRWLSAQRSTILQCSPVHTGMTTDPEASFGDLYKEYVPVPGKE